MALPRGRKPGRKPYKPSRAGEDALKRVVTLTEASELWDISVPTLRHHLFNETLCGRKAGRNWLISVASMVELFGDPTPK